MDSEMIKIIQKKINFKPKENSFSQNEGRLKEISFITPELLKKIESNKTQRGKEVYAYSGLILGGLSLFSWVVILLGVLWSVTGIVLSVIGLQSAQKKIAQIGLALSVLGLLCALVHIYAVYSGAINYNYFINEFWLN